MSVSPGRRWAQALADLAGNPALEAIGTLGVCALEKKKGASAATASLAHWVSQYVERPTLVVEGHFGEPRHALELQAPNVGIKDALIRKDGIETWVQDTANEKSSSWLQGRPSASATSGRHWRSSRRWSRRCASSFPP